MLNIYFGDMEGAIYNTSVFFNNTYEDDWLTDDFARDVIKRIDRSEVVGPQAITSPVLGVIPPERLSGGTKTLLLMKNNPDKVFNASTCGDNCASFILRITIRMCISSHHKGRQEFPKDMPGVPTSQTNHPM